MSGVHNRGTPGSNCDQPMWEPPGLAACSCWPARSPPARRPALTLEGRLNKMTASISMPPRLLTAGPLSTPTRRQIRTLVPKLLQARCRSAQMTESLWGDNYVRASLLPVCRVWLE